MVKFTEVAVGLSALYHAAVSASPMPPQPVRRGDPGALLGFDAGLKDLFGPDATVPEMRELDIDEFRNFTTSAADVPVVEPFIPPSVASGTGFDKRFIVGEDNRVYNGDTSYPFPAVGRLVWSNGVYCSGAMVGPRHVLTARHCLPTASGVSGIFTPGQNNGAPFGSAQVQLAVALPTQSGACNTKADWSVLLIDQRLGERVGYFGAKWPDRNLFDQAIFLHQGYPGDRDGGARPYLQTNTQVHSATSLDCDSTGPIYSDTDTMGGQSGGPFWENTSSGAYIWGALSITVTSSATTYAGWASGNQMVDAIAGLRNDYP